MQLLKQQRDRLNAYCEAVNEEIAASGLSPHVAMGHVLCIRNASADAAPPSLQVDAMRSWDPGGFRRLEALVRELEARLKTMGSPAAHPF